MYMSTSNLEVNVVCVCVFHPPPSSCHFFLHSRREALLNRLITDADRAFVQLNDLVFFTIAQNRRTFTCVLFEEDDGSLVWPASRCRSTSWALRRCPVKLVVLLLWSNGRAMCVCTSCVVALWWSTRCFSFCGFCPKLCCCCVFTSYTHGQLL